MADGGASEGVNSAILASMSQHNDAAVHSGAAAPGTSGLASKVGGELAQGLKKTEISLATPGVDSSLPLTGKGVFGENPFEQAFSDNQSPFGIGHQGFNVNFMGNLDFQEVTGLVSNFNLKKNPTLFSEGQSHG